MTFQQRLTRLASQKRALFRVFCLAVWVSACLALLLVILTKGLSIIEHGLPICALLARENMLQHLLYTACGCALVELLALPLAALGLWIFLPRLWQQTFAIRRVIEGEMSSNDPKG